jgi:hypothetical protein
MTERVHGGEGLSIPVYDEPEWHGREGLSMNGINGAGTRAVQVNSPLDSSPSSLNFSIISPVEHDGILGVTTSKDFFNLHLVELPLKVGFIVRPSVTGIIISPPG